MGAISDKHILDISWGTIFKISIFVISIYILYWIKDIVAWTIFALVISLLMNPIINFLRRIHIPRAISVIIVYFSIFAIFGFTIYRAAPILSAEFSQFSVHFPSYFDKLSPYLRGLKIEALRNFATFSKAVEQTLAKSSVNIFSALGTFFGGIASTFVIFSLAFFFSLEEKGTGRTLVLISPTAHRERILKIWRSSQKKVAAWFGVRLLGMFFVGLSAFIVCYVLNIRYALFFALLVGISDIVVTLGPIISGAIIVVFISLNSLPKAVIFIIAFLLAQEIEAHILIPVLSKKFIHLPSSLVLIALLIGVKLWGIMGAILVVPLAGVLFEFLKDILEKRRESNIQNSSPMGRTTDHY